MVSNNSKKIKKSNRFGELVEQKTKKSAKIVQNRSDLVNEYKSRYKKSGMKDQRFLAKRGFNAKFLGTLDKKQRKKLAFFNIDDDDENSKIVMTHKGVNLDELDDFKDNEIERSISDDNIDADMVQNMHFGGFDEEEGEKDDQRFQERRKTKQEIYSELIHKSKKMKFYRQQQQEEAEEKVQELDDDFDQIAQLLMKNPLQYKEDKKARVKDDPYFALQAQLAYDKRIKPEAVNTQDPKNAQKNGKSKRKGDAEEDEEGSDSELGIEEDISSKKKKKADRKLKNEIKDERVTKKFLSFVDEIKNLKKAHKNDDEDDSLGDLEVDSDEEDEEDGEDDGDEGDEFDDDDDDDEEDF